MSAALALVEIAAADPFGLVRAMNRMAGAGFALSVRDNRLLASPFTKLSEQQRAYLRTHKTAMAEQARNARMAMVARQNIAANRRRALLVRWQEQRERLLAIRPRSEAERQAQVQDLALLDAARPD